MKRRRGIALVTVLFFLVVVVMATAVLSQRAISGSWFQQDDAVDLKAFYAAEAGVQEALASWSADASKSWGLNPLTDNRIQVPLQGGESFYTIRFSAHDSVNNLNQAAAADGPLGIASVPARQAYLVVEGEHRHRRRRVEVMVGASGLVERPAALMGAKGILMSGNVTVSGLGSMLNPLRVPGDLVSLEDQSLPDLIGWSGPGQVDVEGSISSNSPLPASISGSLSAANVSGGNLTAQSRPRPERLDITSRVAAKAGLGLPAPTLTGTHTVLAPGDYYVSGPLNYNGDLELNGANLYVAGGIDINGSVSGAGSVFVDGASSFFGDSSVSASDSGGVALYSKGDVNLSGFDGNRLLADLCAASGSDPNGVPYLNHLANYQKWSAEMRALVPAEPQVTPTHFGVAGAGFDMRVLALTRTAPPGYATATGPNSLGTETAGVSTAEGIPLVNRYLEMGAQLKLTQLVAAQPDSASTRFLQKRFREMNGGDFGVTSGSDVGEYEGPFGRPASPPLTSWTGDDVLRASLQSGKVGHGYYRTLNSVWPSLVDGSYPAADLVARRNQLWTLAYNNLQQMSLDKPGTAFFQGLIYSAGHITAENDLKVLGAVIAGGELSRLNLQRGVQVTYVPEVALSAGASLGRVAVRSWVRR